MLSVCTVLDSTEQYLRVIQAKDAQEKSIKTCKSLFGETDRESKANRPSGLNKLAGEQ